MPTLQKIISLLILSLFSINSFANEITAPISGFARSFILGKELPNGTITILETGNQFKTNEKGQFGPFQYPIGKPITLLFEKWGYKTTQEATLLVPKGGLTDRFNNLTFQVPSIETYYLLAAIIGAKIDDNSCHLTTTVTAFQKTMDDIPQGEPDAKIVIYPHVNETPFYFDIFKDGPLKGKTNPFSKGLVKTSEDGGVAFINLPPREEPYRLTAEKSGVAFTQVEFLCKKGAFINISPPIGPMAQR